MDPPAVRAGVQEMLTATMTDVPFNPDPLKEQESDSLRWERRHTSWASQATCQPDADGDS